MVRHFIANARWLEYARNDYDRGRGEGQRNGCGRSGSLRGENVTQAEGCDSVNAAHADRCGGGPRADCDRSAAMSTMRPA